MYKLSRLGLALAACLALAGTGALFAQTEPCEEGCEGEEEGCTYSTNYVCDNCWLISCIPVPCHFELAREGTRISHKTCDGVHTESWYNAPCGTCYN